MSGPSRVTLNEPVSKSTSEPFGVVLHCAEGWAVAETTIDHRVDGEKICHSAGKKTSIWKRGRWREWEMMGGD